MKRTSQEMTDLFRKVVASQSEDEIANFLEDINDSIAEPDLSNYVSREEYDAVVRDRDAERDKARDYRDRYINRFYNPGNGVNDTTLIQDSANQLTIEREEKRISYDDLFE